MAAPEYVPAPAHQAKAYASPPRRGGSWTATRPGDMLGEDMPVGGGVGFQGPDQGFVRRLVPQFIDRLQLTDAEHRADVIEGCCAVALRRASIFGRAPVNHDLEVAFAVFGFFDVTPDPELVAWRQERFAELSHTVQHYVRGRELVASVPEATLRLTPTAAADAYRGNWRTTVGA